MRREKYQKIFYVKFIYFKNVKNSNPRQVNSQNQILREYNILNYIIFMMKFVFY